MSDSVEDRVREMLITVHGCKPNAEDCVFNRCRSWGRCENMQEAILALIDQEKSCDHLDTPYRRLLKEKEELLQEKKELESENKKLMDLHNLWDPKDFIDIKSYKKLEDRCREYEEELHYISSNPFLDQCHALANNVLTKHRGKK